MYANLYANSYPNVKLAMATKRKKPQKPRKDYPLYAHNRFYWAKKIKGRVYYFGRWEDPTGAEEEYERVRADLYAGRTPSPADAESDSLLEACNLFIHAKGFDVELGELKQAALDEHKRTCAVILKTLGQTKPVKEIKAIDMLAIEQALGKGAAPTTRKVRIGRAKTLFNWLYRMEKINNRLSEKLRSPSKDVIKKAKNAKPKKLFTQKEVYTLLKLATGHLKPCVLLAINCGLGNRDLVELRWEMIGRDGWLDFPRGKTGVERRVKLWPETSRALAAWRKESPESEYVVCDRFGNQVGASGANSPIANQFAAMTKDSNIERNGRGFYTLRHTFRTIADGAKDSNAIRRCMGHTLQGIDADYLEHIEDDRIQAVVDFVHQWMFPKKGEIK